MSFIPVNLSKLPPNPEPTPAPPMYECRSGVRRFASAMESMLRKHDREWPDGWKDARLDVLFCKMLEQVGDLANAHRANDYVRMQKEAADIGNFAMMIRERCSEMCSRDS